MPRPSIDECRARLSACDPADLEELLASLECDPRAGVRTLAATHRRASAASDAESARLFGLMGHQLRLHAEGMRLVAGVDEVGRGALAGPLTLAAVVLPAESRIIGLDDSKRLSPARREIVASLVREDAVALSIVHIGPSEVDAVGIREAVRIGMERAVQALRVRVDHVLVDGNDARLTLPATAVVGGDHLCACIAAASVVAKVTRDALMRKLAPDYPEFGFEVNKGYGTPEHLEALVRCGPSPHHRRSFGPCAQPPLF
ncbi:MAG: ribonuclease HII [Coriobacteriia bacterium]|nr:ribonuclease HII [Coriobacteriia bacterium]